MREDALLKKLAVIGAEARYTIYCIVEFDSALGLLLDAALILMLAVLYQKMEETGLEIRGGEFPDLED